MSATRPLGPAFWGRLLLKVAALLAAGVFLVGTWFYWRLKGSLPVLDGRVRLAGLYQPVHLERDALGVPTIRAAGYVDAARALGFAHGQDRFFQMDLARRRAAGELSALVGRATLSLDQRARVHAFRALSQQALARGTPEQRAVLAAYADGVNAGLRSLSVKPFEYLLLRTKPEPWTSEDTFLVCYSMVFTLQDDRASYLRALNDLRTAFGRQAADFFSPQIGPGDAPLDGSAAPLPEIPGPEVINFRQVSVVADGVPAAFLPDERMVGSNSLAVAATEGSPAMLANDMHLSLGVPNLWYRARLIWPGHDLTGVTLPGVPAIVAGSNGHIAWGLTNSGAGAADLVAVDTDMPDFYVGPGGAELPFQVHSSVVHVRGGADAAATSRWTIWGPVLGPDPAKSTRLLVLHWTEDDPAASNLSLLDLKDATTVADALAIARRSGITPTNFLVADAQGRIGWTIAGRLPQRFGYDGTARWPVSWQYGDRGWKGLLAPDAVPVLTGRDRLSTANQRLLGGDGLRILGDNGYFRGARGAQLAADLRELPPSPGPRHLLAIQLDDRALFLDWWRQLILRLEPGDPAAKDHAGFYAAVRNWGGRAAVDSPGYLLVRNFRRRVGTWAFAPVVARARELDEEFDFSRLNYEPALRAIVSAQPGHLLDPRFASWPQLLLRAVADGMAEVRTPWGRHNTLHATHPLARVLPNFLTSWLNLPADELPGDTDMPRVQAPDFGASERFAVQPGREAEGIFEMPGGQSGHPLSPYYRAGHTAWVRGEPTPFLPGPAAHALLLSP